MNESISYVYFLNMELAQGGGGKEIITQNGKLKYVKDVVEFFQDLENFEKVIEYYNSNNIPTPGLRDIFNIAGGNDVKKFR